MQTAKDMFLEEFPEAKEKQGVSREKIEKNPLSSKTNNSPKSEFWWKGRWLGNLFWKCASYPWPNAEIQTLGLADNKKTALWDEILNEKLGIQVKLMFMITNVHFILLCEDKWTLCMYYDLIVIFMCFSF